MLGKVCLKRLRFVLYAVLFFLLTLDITNRTGDGLIATICIWLALPLAFVAMVWWIYACVRDTVRLLRDGVAPEDAPTWAEYAVWWVQDELAEIAALDGRGKARFFLFRVGGVLLGALGLVLIVRDSVVLGTLLLIAGLTLCITASPQSVNRNCPDQKQLACPPDVTVASLYAAFASVDTPLGKPFLGRIKTIDGDVMIWGRTRGMNTPIFTEAAAGAICISARISFRSGSPRPFRRAKRKTSSWICLSCSPIYAIALRII